MIRLRVLGVALLGAGLLGPALAPASARAADAAVDAKTKKQAAKKFKQGEKLFRAHDYEKAAEAFEEANAIAPHPAPLFNAAQAHEKAGNLVRAANLCARYLRDAPAKDKRRSKANALLADLRPKLGRIAIESVDGENLKIDGTPVELDETYVDPGDHEVSGDFDGETVRRSINVVAGSLGRVVLEKPKPEPVAEKPEPTEVTSDEPGKDTGKAKEKPLPPGWFYAGIATTAVLGGVTVWSGLDTNKARSDYDENPTQSGLDDGRAKQSRTNILLGATAVVGVTTAVVGVFFTNFGKKKKPEAPEEARVWLGVGPGSISAAGRF